MSDISALDPQQVILGALAAGAQEGAKEFVKAEVQHLVDKIKSKFGKDEEAQADLSVYTRRPTLENAEELNKHLALHRLDQDEDVVRNAREVLQQAGPTAVGEGSVAANVITQNIGPQGAAYVGGTHHVTNSYGQVDSRPQIQWQVTYYQGDAYLLENIGYGTAFDVELDVPGAGRVDAPDEGGPIWGAGEGRTFLCALSFGGGSTLEVRYGTTQGGDQKTWRRALPPKPRSTDGLGAVS